VEVQIRHVSNETREEDKSIKLDTHLQQAQSHNELTNNLIDTTPLIRKSKKNMYAKNEDETF
jgi:hypothetical protein